MSVRSVLSVIAQIAFTVLVFFVPAGAFTFWQAWVYLFVLCVLSSAVAVYLRQKDPELLKRRTRFPWNEQNTSQKIIHSIVIFVFVCAIVLSSLDHRFQWSHVPFAVEIAGDVLLALGILTYFVVFRENTFAAATVEVVSDQKVITSGPYAVVRHPMYVGLLTVLFGTPLALGSWWALLTLIPMVPAIAWRVVSEEALLAKSLPGYAEYRRTTRYRLLPFVW